MKLNNSQLLELKNFGMVKIQNFIDENELSKITNSFSYKKEKIIKMLYLLMGLNHFLSN